MLTTYGTGGQFVCFPRHLRGSGMEVVQPDPWQPLGSRQPGRTGRGLTVYASTSPGLPWRCPIPWASKNEPKGCLRTILNPQTILGYETSRKEHDHGFVLFSSGARCNAFPPMFRRTENSGSTSRGLVGLGPSGCIRDPPCAHDIKVIYDGHHVCLMLGAIQSVSCNMFGMLCHSCHSFLQTIYNVSGKLVAWRTADFRFFCGLSAPQGSFNLVGGFNDWDATGP